MNLTGYKKTFRKVNTKYFLLCAIGSAVAFYLFTSFYDDTGHVSTSQVNKLSKVAQANIPATNEKRMCTHEERTNYVKKMCKEGNFPERMGGRLLVDDKNKLFYCEISKSGCTTWKALWENANMGLTNVLPNSTGGVHNKKMEEAGLHFTSYKSETWQNYTKFIVVRNPFDRVLSGYYNVVNKVFGTPGPDKEVTDYFDKYNEANGGFRNLTFLQFMEFLLDKSGNVPLNIQNNRHWKPYSNGCQICYIDYDYIIRIETNDYDSGPVLKFIGYPEDMFIVNKFKLHGNTVKKQTTEVIGDKKLPQYDDIPSSLFSQFIEKYWYDLKLFGYDFDRETSTAVCNVKLDNGKICC